MSLNVIIIEYAEGTGAGVAQGVLVVNSDDAQQTLDRLNMADEHNDCKFTLMKPDSVEDTIEWIRNIT